MTWSIKTRQLASYCSFLGLTIILTIGAYFLLRPGWVYYRQGENYFFAKNFQQAIVLYQKSIKAGLNRPQIMAHLGDAYMATGQFHQAMQVFEGILAHDPNHKGAIRNLAGLYDQFGRLDEAIGLYSKNQHVWSTDLASLLHYVELITRQKNFTLAQTLVRQALQQHPQNISLQIKLAEILSMEKQYDQAIDLYTNILKKYPENRLARLQLARVLSWQGRFEEARVEYRKILGEAK